MEHSPQIEFYKKRDFSDKLNSTFVFIRENAWPYLKVQLMIAGPILLIINIMTNQMQLSFMNPFAMAEGENFIGDMLRIYGILILTGLIAGTVVPTITYGYMKSYQHTAPSEITVAQVTKGFGKRFISLLGFGILSGIVMLIGFFFFLIPGIYLFTVLALGSSIIAFEGSDPFTAFSRCFVLIKEKFFSTLGLIFIVGVIASFINFLFGLPQSIMYGIWAFSSIESGTLNTADMPSYMQALSVVFSVLQAFGNIITYSLIYIALAFQYFNLVERRESKGLMDRIGSMDQEQKEDEDEVY